MSEVEHPIRWVIDAEKDLREILDYIGQDRPMAATLLAARLEEGLGHLSMNPRMGRTLRGDSPVPKDFRYLIVEDYLVFYKFDGHLIRIHRILHGAHDYRSLL